MAKANANTNTAQPTAAVEAATGIAHTAPTHKYKAPAKVPCAAINYTLTNAGLAAAQTVAGKSGKPTVMALVAFAAAQAGATASKPVSGLAIVQAMQSNQAIVAAYGNTKAGMYAPKGTVPCANWCSGYVTGAARAAAGLLAKQA